MRISFCKKIAKLQNVSLYQNICVVIIYLPYAHRCSVNNVLYVGAYWEKEVKELNSSELYLQTNQTESVYWIQIINIYQLFSMPNYYWNEIFFTGYWKGSDYRTMGKLLGDFKKITFFPDYKSVNSFQENMRTF